MFNLLAISQTEMLNLIDATATKVGAIMSVISSVVIWLVGHVFMAIAIWVMAKNKGINKGRWLALIPFANYYLLGKIIGEAVVWGKKIKNVGLWAMIFYIISSVVNFFLDIGSYIYDIQIIFSVEFSFTNAFIKSWVYGTSVLYRIILYTSFIWDIAYIFFEVSMIFLVFRLYRPQSAMLYSLLSIFLNPPLFGILLFVVRKNERISFKQYFYTPYNNPYGNPYQTPNQNQNPAEPPKAPEDPFPEFSNKSGEQNSNSSDKDDLFS
ncbi:MAG: hypothetical protein IJA97_00290 [Clostridia bacterium]|nr:hypothetical protein [Clostridia bacterium]